jgi:hypothetical protein
MDEELLPVVCGQCHWHPWAGGTRVRDGRHGHLLCACGESYGARLIFMRHSKMRRHMLHFSCGLRSCRWLRLRRGCGALNPAQGPGIAAVHPERCLIDLCFPAGRGCGKDVPDIQPGVQQGHPLQPVRLPGELPPTQAARGPQHHASILAALRKPPAASQPVCWCSSLLPRPTCCCPAPII